MAYFSILAMVCQSTIIIFLRGYYMISVFASLVFGHYFWILAERVSWLIDVKLFNIPFHKRFPKFINKCGFCKYNINEWASIGETFEKLEQ